MKEDLYYININDQAHLVHEHIPIEVKEKPYIFLNPIFDEKKRGQRFYAETAREFCENGIPVIRFDYYGTGDSEGHLIDMNLNNIEKIVRRFIETFKDKYKVQKINLFGLRLGADIAISVAENNPQDVHTLILVEPVVKGKRYLIEQRSRRKMFYKLNNMSEVKDEIVFNGKTYEDHQGYPISSENLFFLNNLDSINTRIINKDILLVKLNAISSRKLILQLHQCLEKQNNVNHVNYSCDDFWSSLESISTKGLTDKILGEVMSCNSSVSSIL